MLKHFIRKFLVRLTPIPKVMSTPTTKRLMVKRTNIKLLCHEIKAISMPTMSLRRENAKCCFPRVRGQCCWLKEVSCPFDTHSESSCQTDKKSDSEVLFVPCVRQYHKPLALVRLPNSISSSFDEHNAIRRFVVGVLTKHNSEIPPAPFTKGGEMLKFPHKTLRRWWTP
jgi:hypothetical protein